MSKFVILAELNAFDMINSYMMLPTWLLFLNLIYVIYIPPFRLKVKCRLLTCGPDLWTGKGVGLVLGFMLRVRVRV